MKIAYVSMFYTPTIGGVEKVIEELAHRMVKGGHEVHVFCCDSDKYHRIKKKEEIINGVYVHRHRYWFKLSMFTYIWPTLLFTLPRYKFDVIHSHVAGHAYVFFAGLIAKIKGIPYVHTTHCPWTDSFRTLPARIGLFFADIIFNRLSFKLCDKVIAITPWELTFIRKYGVPENKIVIIPNGMNEVLYKKITPNNFKKKHNIIGKVVLFFGRLNVTKGPDKFVLAAKEILKEKKGITFVMLGPDEGMKETIKNMIKGEKNIILLGPTRDKKEIASMYQAADVYVLPSYREGLPLTLFEAMASGLPIVASPVNGVPYEMKEPDNGLFVNYGDITGLRKAILKILDNPSLAKKIRANNKKRALGYSWGDITKRTIKVYEDVLRK